MDTEILLCYTLRFLLCCTFIAYISTASHTISPGQSLSGAQTITSPSGTFELGFFIPDIPPNYYIGIWYKNQSTQIINTTVWVANRKQPVFEPKLSVWMHVVIWQSFDHLLDTWLPAAELGYNNRTKRKLVLTSWRNVQNPAPGPFSFELDGLPFNLSDYSDALIRATLEVNGQLTFYACQCYMWTGDLNNIRITQPSTLDFISSSPDSTVWYLRIVDSKNETMRKTTWIVIGVLVGFFSILSSAFIVMIFFRRRLSVGALATNGDSLVLYKHRDLRRATKNFSQKLEEGAFGSVFKGMLPNSIAIVVKELKSTNRGEKQFCAEVGTMGVIQQINLIRMRGFCVNNSRRLLVYDYMPNGSLQSLLLPKNPIMLDYMPNKDLAYLHDDCRDCIIHCDVKPENILLDSEYSPKLADFGLANLLGRHHSRNFLPIRLANAVNKGQDLFALLDCRLEGEADGDELSRACKVVCWCIQEDENDRPTMMQVVQILEGVLDIGVPPVPQFLQRLI
ncbi:unnamed protein product [Malus baccata var. baccata]